MQERRLTKSEIDSLLETAPDTETRNLTKYLVARYMDAYQFFDQVAVEHFGLVNEDRPIYLGVLTFNLDTQQHEIWTVVNSNVKEQFSLFKHSKRKIIGLAKKYGKLYARMEKVNIKNMKWTERLGFKKTSEDDTTITYCLEGG